MNATLYKQMLKVYMKGFVNYAFGSAFYILLMFWLYPSMAKNTIALDELVRAMPEGVGRAFGLNGFGSAEAFISGEFYGLILVLILAIVCVQLSTQLMAKLVDQGSMAYLLSTPTTRGKVAFTQASVLTTGLFLIMAVTTIAGFLGKAWFLGDFEFDTTKFIKMNISAFLLFFAVGGISFLVSSLSNDEKKALGISGFITFGFFSLDLLGKLSVKIEWMRNISIFSMYRPGEIINGNVDLVATSIVLAAIGFVSFGLAIATFRKRDLPL
ncbi:ABC transporter permease subunit [Paenibacillus sp. GP183]|jgi:ABC-2 type transport system permease protein|uniref:ABC transporter permease subunit n=1 Tax=Paenibacillus sp. GP183 TaxID=1882751 RepID=UPI000899FDD0|nr:ABC transporter permease subunit [Paenibacillus sp. GP183]SEC26026.1 ABC-2 type transport system permease protein [Paenibacillus sp. GP183]